MRKRSHRSSQGKCSAGALDGLRAGSDHQSDWNGEPQSGLSLNNVIAKDQKKVPQWNLLSVETLRANTSVEVDGEIYAITVKFDAPEEAAMLANAVAKSFMQSTGGDLTNSNEKTDTALTDRVEKLQRRLEAAETQLATKREQVRDQAQTSHGGGRLPTIVSGGRQSQDTVGQANNPRMNLLASDFVLAQSRLTDLELALGPSHREVVLARLEKERIGRLIRNEMDVQRARTQTQAPLGAVDQSSLTVAQPIAGVSYTPTGSIATAKPNGVPSVSQPTLMSPMPAPAATNPMGELFFTLSVAVCLLTALFLFKRIAYRNKEEEDDEFINPPEQEGGLEVFTDDLPKSFKKPGHEELFSSKPDKQVEIKGVVDRLKLDLGVSQLSGKSNVPENSEKDALFENEGTTGPQDLLDSDKAASEQRSPEPLLDQPNAGPNEPQVKSQDIGSPLQSGHSPNQVMQMEMQAERDESGQVHRRRLQPRRRHIEQPRLPVLASLPLLEFRKTLLSKASTFNAFAHHVCEICSEGSSSLIEDEMSRSYLQTIQDVFSTIERHGRSHSSRTVLLSGPFQNVGQSTFAYALSSFAQSKGKMVLLIDANMKRQALTAFFKISGATDSDLLKTLKEDKQSGAVFMPLANFLESKQDSQMGRADHSIYKAIAKQFDLIIIDAGQFPQIDPDDLLFDDVDFMIVPMGQDPRAGDEFVELYQNISEVAGDTPWALLETMTDLTARRLDKELEKATKNGLIRVFLKKSVITEGWIGIKDCNAFGLQSTQLTLMQYATLAKMMIDT